MNDLFAPFTVYYIIRDGWGEVISREAVWVRWHGPYSALFNIRGRETLVAKGKWE